MELSKEKMHEIDGGASWGLVAGIAVAVVYVIGFFSGFTNPTRCHN